jgi:hypothetical protein
VPVTAVVVVPVAGVVSAVVPVPAPTVVPVPSAAVGVVEAAFPVTGPPPLAFVVDGGSAKKNLLNIYKWIKVIFANYQDFF